MLQVKDFIVRLSTTINFIETLLDTIKCETTYTNFDLAHVIATIIQVEVHVCYMIG